PVNRRTTLAAIALGSAVALAGCGSSSGSDGKPDLKVSGAYMPQPVTADMAAGFLTVTNASGTKDKLTSVTSDTAGSITVHETSVQTMRMVTPLDVPAHGTLDLERGGNHLMFEKLKRKPLQGEKVSVELHFEKAGTVKAELPVKETTYNP